MEKKNSQQEKKRLNSTRDGEIIPMRATYFNLYKWPESDCEFIESIILRGSDGRSSSMYGDGTAVGGFTSRQLYLRSYTFSTKEDYTTTINCFGRSSKNKTKRFYADGRRSKCAARSTLRRWLCIPGSDAVD